MSYGGGDTNGYANGYRSNRYDDNPYERDQGSSSSAARRARRAGGYGGFTDYGSGGADRATTPPSRGGESEREPTPLRDRERETPSYRDRERETPPFRERDRDRDRDRERDTPPRQRDAPPRDLDPEPEARSTFTSRLDRLQRDREERRRAREAQRNDQGQSQRDRDDTPSLRDRQERKEREDRESADKESRTNGLSSSRSGGSSSRYDDPYGNGYDAGPPPRSADRELGSFRSRDRDRDRDRDQDRDVPSFRSRNRLRPGGNESRRLYGDGPAGSALEDVMDHIQDRWEVLTKSDCVPVQVSLQLLDTSSLGRGRDYDDFRSTGKALHKGLKTIVNEHHQGFNSSLGTFHKIQSGIQASQERVQTLKAALITARANLTVTRAGLKDLALSSQNYEDMLQVLAQIEKLQVIPEQLDTKISEKHFLSAVDVLQDGLRLIRHSSLDNVGALSDLRIYLNNQETSLTDILLEELHDHLYLKSPYTTSRWRAYAQVTADGAAAVQNPSNITTGIRPLYRFLAALNTTQPLTHESGRNPEEDNFAYMHALIEALNKMGRLEMAVERLEQRLPVELYSVVERTNQEVDTRHPRHLRTAQTSVWTRTQLRTTAAETRETVLKDFLYTLYSKFEAIAEGHRAVHEVLHGIIERERIRKSENLLKGFKELWKLLQAEIRSLMHDYLTADGSLTSGRDATHGPGSIFKKQKRDKSKRVFRMADLDKKQLSSEQSELDKILQASVPGLVSNSAKRSDTNSNEQSVSYEPTSASHKLLVEANVFNISILLPPSLTFLHRLKDTVPPDSDIAVSTLTSFLDDFLVNVFSPQLDDTAGELCTQAIVQADAFQEDPQWQEYSKIPIFKGTVTFFLIVRDFCKMLDDIPQDQIFTTLLINQLQIYHRRCSEWSQNLLSRVQNEGDAKLKPAPAAVKEGGELIETLKSLWESEKAAKEQPAAKLIELLVARAVEKPITEYDTISDQRAAKALCLLYSSMQWLSSQLQGLRYIVKKEDAADSKKKKQAHRWTMLSAAAMRDGDHPVVIPLTEDSAS